MSKTQLLAVDHVHLDSPYGVQDGLRWFYAELVGLSEVATANQDQLVFKSGLLELRIRCVERPDIDPVRCRLVVMVVDLQAVRAILSERSYWHVPLTGTVRTDRRLETFDPAGHRVQLKQDFPEVF